MFLATTRRSTGCRNAPPRSLKKRPRLFVPTGCMGNEIAVKVHTKPGQEIIIEERGHILNYELGGRGDHFRRDDPGSKKRRRLGTSDVGRDRAGS